MADVGATDRDCRRCYFSQVPAINDRFFIEAVRPYTWFAAVLLFLSYIIGLWFTLRTHAAVIWNIEIEEKKLQPATGPNGSISHQANGPKAQHSDSSGGTVGRNAIRDSQLYKRILGQSLKQVGLGLSQESSRHSSSAVENQQGQSQQPPHLIPPKSASGDSYMNDAASQHSVQLAGLTEEQNVTFIRQVAEMAATAATVAARDAARAPKKTSAIANTPARTPRDAAMKKPMKHHPDDDEGIAADVVSHDAGGGHDAPNWSRLKSAVILMGATVLYAIIAEILVNTVDVVLESVDIDEKFLGITLFALVPNTTEFLVSLGSSTLCDLRLILPRMPYHSL